MTFVNNLFFLSALVGKKKTNITMHMRTNSYNTGYLPRTYSILKKKLPKVLRTKCFNNKNLPFHKEVLDTQIPHLFEHILLVYLCEHKKQKHTADFVLSGITSWNWTKDIEGVFYIKISVNDEDLDIIPLCLVKSVDLLMEILLSEEKIAAPSFSAADEFPHLPPMSY